MANAQLRSAKGARFIPVLAAIICNEKGEVLIARRRTELRNGDLWEFPGGKLQPGETPEQGLRREIREEMGINIDVEAPFHIVAQSAAEYDILLIAYWCRHRSGAIQLSDHSRVLWVPPAELPRFSMTPADVGVVQKLLQSSRQRPSCD